jgi:hypothetical protein
MMADAAHQTPVNGLARGGRADEGGGSGLASTDEMIGPRRSAFSLGA